PAMSHPNRSSWFGSPGPSRRPRPKPLCSRRSARSAASPPSLRGAPIADARAYAARGLRAGTVGRDRGAYIAALRPVARRADRGRVCMALLEDTLGGWGGGLVIGLGAAVVGPAVVPVAGATLRPVARLLVRGLLAAGDGVRSVFAESSAQFTDHGGQVCGEQARGEGP